MFKSIHQSHRFTSVTCALALFLCEPVWSDTFTVEALSDGVFSGDTNPGDGVCGNIVGICQLRTAIEEANARPGIDAIEFSVAGTFTPHADAGALPAITDQIIIFGNTAPGYPGLNVDLEQAPPAVYLSGSTAFNGLEFSGGAAGSLVYALGIVGFNNAILILDGADNMNIHGCYIGVLGDGLPEPNSGSGIRVQSDGNIIGQFIAANEPQEYGNVISANGNHGISLVSSQDNRISGNRIGTSPDGLSALGNGGNGIDARTPLRNPQGSSNGNVIGEVDADDAIPNLIGGNVGHGIYLNSALNLVLANRIGVSLSGQPIGNGGDGVNMLGSGNSIGHSATQVTNLIANNRSGVVSQGVTNSIISNQIGLNDQGHARYGIEVLNSENTMVLDNVILHAAAGGIILSGDDEPSIQNNRIGVAYLSGEPVDAGSTSPLAAALTLDSVSGASVFQNTLGYYTTGISLRNVTGGGIAGNFVGADADARAIPNLGTGIALRDAMNTFVSLNRVMFNGSGILLAGDVSATSLALVRQNLIARNTGFGVQVSEADDASFNLRNRITENAIYANGGLGIDLGADGITPNDMDDDDSGDNKLQNYPELVDAIAPAMPGGELVVAWRMDSDMVNSAYPIRAHFYLADSLQSGQGRVYLGTDTVASADTQQMSNFPLPGTSAGGWLVATATDDEGNTSEFSPVFTFGDLLFADGLEGI